MAKSMVLHCTVVQLRAGWRCGSLEWCRRASPADGRFDCATSPYHVRNTENGCVKSTIGPCARTILQLRLVLGRFHWERSLWIQGFGSALWSPAATSSQRVDGGIGAQWPLRPQTRRTAVPFSSTTSTRPVLDFEWQTYNSRILPASFLPVCHLTISDDAIQYCFTFHAVNRNAADFNPLAFFIHYTCRYLYLCFVWKLVASVQFLVFTYSYFF